MSAETDRLLHWMPIIVRSSGITEWERKFCASIIHKSQGGAFSPSRKQVGVMRRIVDKFQAETMGDDEVTE